VQTGRHTARNDNQRAKGGTISKNTKEETVMPCEVVFTYNVFNSLLCSTNYSILLVNFPLTELSS
jgi:hypothetical protein